MTTATASTNRLPWKTSGLYAPVMWNGDEEITLDKAAAALEYWGQPLSPILERFDDWAVTTHGLECLSHPYSIEKERLGEDDWMRHMCEKPWVKPMVFGAALDAARRVHANRHPERQARHTRHKRKDMRVSIRFRILKRDKYKCRLCGRSGSDSGVELEVDHKTALAVGGTNDPDNLWTLCKSCNSGKGVSAV